MRDTFIQARLNGITPPDREAMEAARLHWDAIAKPLHGLGRLEDMVVRIAGAAGTPGGAPGPEGGGGVLRRQRGGGRGVTQTGQEVTLAVARSMAARAVLRLPHGPGGRGGGPSGGRGDAGPRGSPRSAGPGGHGGWDPEHDQGSRYGPLRRRGALRAGLETAEELADRGIKLLAAGEMGIGNTTTTAAVAAALLGQLPEETVGRGAGLSDEGLVRKRRAVAAALAVNRPDPADPMDVLCKVGGLDIAAMTGFYLGCAFRKLPVLLDGAISCAAALCAVRLCPQAEKSLLGQPPSGGALRPSAAGGPGAGAGAGRRTATGRGHRGGGRYAPAGHGPVGVWRDAHL